MKYFIKNKNLFILNYKSYFNSFQSNTQNKNNPKNIPIYQYYNMMNLNKLNYFNQLNYINNQILLNRLNNNQGNNNINIINSGALGDNNLMIDIPQMLLTKIEKKYLIDLILFIRNFCNLKINNKYLDFKHDIYEIKIYKNKNCTINIKDSKKKSLENIEKKEEDIKEENINENENIINEEQKNEIKDKEDKENHLGDKNVINSINEEYNDDIILISTNNHYFLCKNHNKEFKTKDSLMSHCKSTHRFRCEECGKMFGTMKKMNNHLKICEKKRLKENKIKCSECDLFFDDVETMTIHFYEMHDIKNQKNIEDQKIKLLLKRDIDIMNHKICYFYFIKI